MRRFWVAVLSLVFGFACGAGFMAYRDRPPAHGPWEDYAGWVESFKDTPVGLNAQIQDLRVRIEALEKAGKTR